MMDNLKSNKYFKIMMTFSGILATTPISILFYQAYGITFNQIMIIKTCTFIATILFEVPSGYIGDKIGYKKIMLLGLFCLIVSCLGNVFYHSVVLFAVWGIVWGIGIAMLSGADEAWYYSFLKQNKKENEYGSNISEILSAIQFITAGALIVSSAIFVIDKRLPYILNAIFFAVAFFAATKLTENRLKESKEKVKDEKVTAAFKIVNFNNVYFIISEVLFMAITVFIFETYQPQMAECKIPVSSLGLIYFCFTIITGFGSRAYKFVREKSNSIEFSLKYYFMLIFFQAATVVVLSVLSISTIGVLMIFGVQEFLYGYFNVYSNAAINSRIGDEYRATLISVKSLLVCGTKSLTFLLLGKVMGIFHLKVTYMVIAVVLVSGCILIGSGSKIHSTIKQKQTVCE